MRSWISIAIALAACQPRHEPQPRNHEGSGSGSAPAVASGKLDQLSRADFNRFAVRQDLPIYWVDDANHDRAVDADEVVPLLFYPQPSVPLADAYAKILAASKAPPASDPRLALVERDLDGGVPTLVRTDLRGVSPAEHAFAEHMLAAAIVIDHMYEQQNGESALASKVPSDPESQSLFLRDRGPKCATPALDRDPQCSAIPGSPKPIVDVYPAALQASATFCKDLEARPDAKALLGPFTVVRDQAGKLAAVPYSEAYKDAIAKLRAELEAAADAMAKEASEQPLVTYLRAAAKSFTTNDWLPADEAWAKMSVDNSKWYVRVAPDETYWEPCSHKAAFHFNLAKIDQGSKRWQDKLVPVQQDMEAAIAARAGAPYTARKVTFHLPDFIDIILNSGDDRHPMTATIGESLPNWGPVANEGRGRTVAMINIYSDPDSRARRRTQAATLLAADAMKIYTDDHEPGVLVTVLHEATHNLGPAHQYKVGGKTDEEVFGGPISSAFEELKAQTGALFLIDFLRGKGLVSDELARQAYADAIVWALGHVSEGMYGAGDQRKTYGNVAAIQLGFLLEHGALTWDAATPAANGSDHGAFTIHFDKLPAAADEMMKTVAGIKARGDKAAAEALLARYVDAETVVPHKLIAERFRRVPKGSLVYSVAL